jgi:molybdate transport system permease protein
MLLVLACLPMVLFLGLPSLGLLFRVSFSDLVGTIFTPEVSQAISLSAETTLITIILTIVGGTPVAWLLARGKFAGKNLLDTLFDLPVVLPPAVAGIALLVVFGRKGFLGNLLGSAGIELPFTEAAVVLAQLFVASPLYIKSAAAGFSAVDRDLEQAAAIDGASPAQVFRRVTVPLSAQALIGGAIMTWARALGEFGATIIFAGNFPGRTQTMPLAIYMGFEIDLRNALTLALILLVVSFTVLAIIRGLLRQRMVMI